MNTAKMIQKTNNTVAIKNLSVRFENKKVLSKISLEVKPGEKFAILGRSGSGKTTLLKAILGLIRPDSGNIYINGEELSSDTIWNARLHMAYVTQEPELGTGKIREILTHPFDFHANQSKKENMEKAESLFKEFLLPKKLLSEDITSLSGGEKQRVALISALLLERKILLLDEVTSALDKKSKRKVLDYLQKQKDMTIIYITHDIKTFKLGDNCITIPGGIEEE